MKKKEKEGVGAGLFGLRGPVGGRRGVRQRRKGLTEIKFWKRGKKGGSGDCLGIGRRREGGGDRG